MNSNEQLDALARRSVQPDGSAGTYATKSEIAKCAALTAANFIEKGWWVEAYIELHAAARVCYERRDEERQQQNPHSPSILDGVALPSVEASYLSTLSSSRP